MLRRFYPKDYFESTYSINFKKFYMLGYRGIIFDIDNTLVEHDAPADDRAVELISKLKSIGFKVCFLSNNDEKRVSDFNEVLAASIFLRQENLSQRDMLQLWKRWELTR